MFRVLAHPGIEISSFAVSLQKCLVLKRRPSEGLDKFGQTHDFGLRLVPLCMTRWNDSWRNPPISDNWLMIQEKCPYAIANVLISLHICAVCSDLSCVHRYLYSVNSFCKRATKAQISLHKCAGWSGHPLPAYAIRSFNSALDSEDFDQHVRIPLGWEFALYYNWRPDCARAKPSLGGWYSFMSFGSLVSGAP